MPIRDVEEGLSYEVPSPAPLVARVSAEVSAGSMVVTLALKNAGATSLELVSPRVSVTDGRGVQFVVRSRMPVVCYRSIYNRLVKYGDRWQIPPGEICIIRTYVDTYWVVNGSIVHRDDAALARIRVRLQSADPKPFPDLDIPMSQIN
jgi:hypothetical protein